MRVCACVCVSENEYVCIFICICMCMNINEEKTHIIDIFSHLSLIRLMLRNFFLNPQQNVPTGANDRRPPPSVSPYVSL